MPATSLSLALLLLGAAPAPAGQGAWILSCAIGVADRPGSEAVRVFRVAPALLQEWKPELKSFGPNLCESFRCKADTARLEASIESASLIFTINFDRQARRASWRTVGASGLSRTSGPCSAQAEPAKGS